MATTVPFALLSYYFLFGLAWIFFTLFLKNFINEEQDPYVVTLLVNRLVFIALGSFFLYWLLKKVAILPSINNHRLTPFSLACAAADAMSGLDGVRAYIRPFCH